LSEDIEGLNVAEVKVGLGAPYMVTGEVRLVDADGGLLPTKSPLTALCRCGQSSNKPYCDGTHVKVGFVGMKESDRQLDVIDEYIGDDITILDNRGVCAHSGGCTDNLSKVFRMTEEPWIHPDSALAEEIIKVVEDCPSGALGYRHAGTEYAPPSSGATVQVTVNGPHHVTGLLKLDDDQGTVPQYAEKYALCRCGRSKNKPLCSGAHWDDFEDDGKWKGSAS